MVDWSQLGILGYLASPAAGGILAEHLGYAASASYQRPHSLVASSSHQSKRVEKDE